MHRQISRRTTAFSIALLAALASFPCAQAEEAKAEAKPATETNSTIWRPGQPLTINTDTEDIVATYDIALAKKQVAAYPDNPEAACILAVALTRTSRVEEALTEIRRARKLAEAKGDPKYFDKMTNAYENMLTDYPDANQVRYTLSWAYYMKAYLLSRWSRNHANSAGKMLQVTPAAVAAAPTTGVAPSPTPALSTPSSNPATAATPAATPQVATAAVPAVTTPNTVAGIQFLPSLVELAQPEDRPQIRQYYELGLKHLDDLIAREPDDVWPIVYRAHLKAEYTGNLEEAMKTWSEVQKKYPNNPAAYFFLGEGYLKQGNLKESLTHVSKAIALRALGN